MKETDLFVLSGDIPEAYSFTPEKGLIAAVLEIAIRDLLNSNSWAFKREAICWFLYKPPSDPFAITFQNCIDYLDLSDEKVKFLQNKAKEAEVYLDEQMRKRKESREANRELAKKPWCLFRSPDAAVLRRFRGRDVRYTGSHRTSNVAPGMQGNKKCNGS